MARDETSVGGLNSQQFLNFWTNEDQKDFFFLLECILPENPRTSCLDSVKILLLVQKQFNNQIPSFLVVEKYKQRPVDQPCPLLQNKKNGWY